MKCENCGKNEVTFVYRSNINGTVEEKHLCSECAGQMGYLEKLAHHRRSMQEEFFGRDFFGRNLLSEFLTPGGNWLSPFEELFEEMPALRAGHEEGCVKEEQLLDQKEQGRFARMRKLNALKVEMKKAVRQENFERAAQLRDEIRALENTKESA